MGDDERAPDLVVAVTMGNEAYWTSYRAYVRRRASARAALILTPVATVLNIVLAIFPPVYGAGDPRGDFMWRLAVCAAFEAVLIAALTYSLRLLLADRRGERSPRPET